jgi:SagB-type dehydrogenase family enzyme
VPGHRLVCRRSAHLVCYWRGAEVVIENYATRTRVTAPPVACHILAFFDRWRSLDSLLRSHPPDIHGTLRSLVRQLVRHSLLQQAGAAVPAAERAMAAWQAWNPVAGFFHAATRDVPFSDMATQVRSLRAKRAARPMPNAIKRYAGVPTVRLPSHQSTSEFADVLLARRTWRRFADAPVDLASFATLLKLTAGVQRWANAAGEGRVALKTSPSGGARHAIEVYTLVRKVGGLRPGWYHYAADVHALERVGAGASRAHVRRYLPQQPWYEGAAAIVFFGAVFERELWRYPYARAYRALLIEAGHLCQTFCLSATWLGLAPFCTMALADSAIEQALGLDGIGESVLYAAGIGARPAGARSPGTKAPGTSGALTRAEVRTFPGRILPRKSP